MEKNTLTADQCEMALFLLRTAVGGTYGSAAKWAKEHGISAAFVSMVLNGRKKPSRRLCRLLGYEL
jgi:hypothetical protein